MLDELDSAVTAVEAIYDKWDAILAAALERQKVTPSCTSCFRPYCCSHRPLVSPMEAFGIAMQLRKTGRDSPDLRQALRTIANEMAAVDDEVDWYARRRPCVFLSSTGRCTVYAQRPIACRSYMTRDDPAGCAEFEHGIVEVPSWMAFGILRLFQVGLLLGVRTHVPAGAHLPLAVLWLLEALDEPERFAKRVLRNDWKGEMERQQRRNANLVAVTRLTRRTVIQKP